MANSCINLSMNYASRILADANKLLPTNHPASLNNLQTALQKFIRFVNFTPNITPNADVFASYNETSDLFGINNENSPIKYMLAQVSRNERNAVIEHEIENISDVSFKISTTDPLAKNNVSIIVDINRSNNPNRINGVPNVVSLKVERQEQEKKMDFDTLVQAYDIVYRELNNRVNGDIRISQVDVDDGQSGEIAYLLLSTTFPVTEEVASEGSLPNIFENMFIKAGQVYSGVPVFGINKSWTLNSEQVVEQWTKDTKPITRDSNHIYRYNGVVVKNQTSVTSFGRDDNYIPTDQRNPSQQTTAFSSREANVGTLVDKNVRYILNTYFVDTNGKWAEIPTSDFNVNTGKIAVPSSFIADLQKFTAMISNKYGEYGKDWHLLTNPPYLVGNVNYIDSGQNLQSQTMFGEMDLVIYTNDGKFIIIDMKTTNKPRDVIKERYSEQLNRYKHLLHNSYNIPLENISMYVLQFEYNSIIDNITLDADENHFMLKDDTTNIVLNPQSEKLSKQFKLKISTVNENSTKSLDEITLDDTLIGIEDADLGIITGFTKTEFNQGNKNNAHVVQNLTGETPLVKTSLYDSTKITATERAFFAKSVGDLFAFTTRRISTDKSFFDKIKIGTPAENVDFNSIKDNVKEAIRAFGDKNTNKLSSGAMNLMNFVKEAYFNPEDYDPIATPSDVIEKTKIAYDNFNKLIVLANPILMLTTGIYVRGINVENNLDIDDNITSKMIDQSEEEYNKLENEIIEQGQKETNYSLQLQNISAIQGMSAEMRSIFETFIESSNHPTFTNIPVFYNSTAVMDRILRLVSGAEDSDVMFSILHLYEKDEPYIKPLLKRIENNPNLRRKFWNAFSKTFNSAIVINSTENDDGTLMHNNIPANESRLGNRYFSNSMQLLHSHNSTSLFAAIEEKGETFVERKKSVTDNQVDNLRKKLNELKGKFNINKSDSLINSIYDTATGTFDIDKINEVAKEFSDLSAYLGAKIPEYIISTEIKRLLTTKDRKNINDIFNSFTDILSISGRVPISKFSDRYYKNIDNALEKIPSILTERESGHAEAGKTFYSYQPDSYIERRFSKLTDSINRVMPEGNKIEKSDEYIDKEFGRSYLLNGSPSESFRFRIPMLNWLYKNDKAKEILKKVYIPMSDKTEFSRMGDLQYAATFLSLYYQDRKDGGYNNTRTAYYAIPLYSNKGVYEAVRMYGYSRKSNTNELNLKTFNNGNNGQNKLFDYKDKIADDLVLLSRYEIDRMKTVLARLFESNSPYDKIKNVDIDPSKVKNYTEIKGRYLSGKLTIDDIAEIFASSRTFKFNIASWLNSIFDKKKTDFIDYLNGKYEDEEQSTWEKMQHEFDRFDKICFKDGKPITFDSPKQLFEELGNMIANEFSRKQTETDGSIDFNKLDSILFVLNKFGMENHAEKELEFYRNLGLLDMTEGKKFVYLDQYMPNFAKENNAKFTFDEYIQEGIDIMDEFIWNDYLAKHNIILMTSGDISQYDGVQDFFKRNAQVHSPIQKADKAAVGKFYDGKQFSTMKISKDRKMRYGLIKDEQLFSEFGTHLTSIAKAFFNSLSDDIMSRDDKDRMIKYYVGIANQFAQGSKHTDSQAFNSPTSFAKKMQAVGLNWTDRHQNAYEQIIQGNFNDNNSDVLFEILKPFSFSNKWISTGLDSDSRGFSEMPISMQNKNSEYLLLMFGAIARNSNQKLKAIYDFMEMSHYTDQQRTKDSNSPMTLGSYNGLGIDTIEFVSASKDAPYGAVDLSGLSSYEEVMNELKQWFYDGNAMTPDNYNTLHVQEIEFDDYGKQTSMTEHLESSMKLEPSQERAIVAGNTMDEEDVSVSGETIKAKDAREELERLQGLGIVEDADSVAEMLGASYDNDGNLRNYNGIYNFDTKELKARVSQIATKSQQRILQQNQEMITGLEIDANGNTVIPIGELSQSAKMQQLMNSIVKSNVNKQMKDGGSAVQVSSYTHQDNLSMVFVDSEGKAVLTLREYVELNYPNIKWKTSQFVKQTKGFDETHKAILKSYNDYVDSKELKFSHYEIYMKCPSEAIRRMFTKEGHLMSVPDIRKWIQENPDTTPISLDDFEESLKILACRVPFEDLYSSFPCKIKDWLPDTSGMAAVFPKELSLISGSDFDADKAHYTKKTLNPTGGSKGSIQYTFDRYNENDEFHSGRSQRNNRIFDLKWGFVTSKSATMRMMSPGSFETQKRIKYILEITKHLTKENGEKYSLAELKNMTFNELANLYSTIDYGFNVASGSTQVHFHKVNSSAQVNIGGTANHNTSHALLTHQNLRILFGRNDYQIGDHKIDFFGIDLTSPEGIAFDSIFALDGTYTSRVLANFLDAFVDTTKESVGEELNVNVATLNVMCTLARMGLSEEQIAMFLAQPSLVEAVDEFFKTDSSKGNFIGIRYVVNDLFNKKLQQISEDKKVQEDIKTKMWDQLGPSSGGITIEKLFDRISGNMDAETEEVFDLAILKLFNILNTKSKAVSTLTKITQCNSIRNSPGPEWLDTFLLRTEIEKFIQDEKDPSKRNFINVVNPSDASDTIITRHPIINAFYNSTLSDTSLTEQIFSEMFIESSSTMKNLMSQFVNQFRYVPSRNVLNYLIRDFIYYNAISQGVFDNSYENRKYLITEFSDSFASRNFNVFKGFNGIATSQSIKEAWDIIENNSFVKKLEYVSKTGRHKEELTELKINFADETDVAVKQDIIASFEDLIASNNGLVKQFGINLLNYMIVKNGLNFSNLTTFTSLSTRTKLEMNEFLVGRNGTRYLDMFNPESYENLYIDFNRFFDQFYRNRYYVDNMVTTIKLNSKKNKFGIVRPNDKSDNSITISTKKNGKNTNWKESLYLFLPHNNIAFNRLSTDDFIPFFMTNTGDLYKIRDINVTPDTNNNDSSNASVVNITYEKTSKLSVKNHYVQYFTEDIEQNALESQEEDATIPGESKEIIKESTNDAIDEFSDIDISPSNGAGVKQSSFGKLFGVTKQQDAQVKEKLEEAKICKSN